MSNYEYINQNVFRQALHLFVATYEIEARSYSETKDQKERAEILIALENLRFYIAHLRQDLKEL